MKDQLYWNRLLKGMLTVVPACVGVGLGIVAGRRMMKQAVAKEKLYAGKHLAILQLFNQWMVTKQEGKSIAEYLQKSGIRTVAIYGMSYVGERLYDELKDTDIEIKYVIDMQVKDGFEETDIFTLEDDLPEVDLIIVTAVFFYYEIEKSIHNVCDYEVVSLEEILYGI